jgi:hypothetical protein
MSEGGDGSVLDPGQQVMCFVATGSDNTLALTHARTDSHTWCHDARMYLRAKMYACVCTPSRAWVASPWSFELRAACIFACTHEEQLIPTLPRCVSCLSHCPILLPLQTGDDGTGSGGVGGGSASGGDDNTSDAVRAARDGLHVARA